MIQGQELSADVSNISDADGMDNATFTYAWKADDSPLNEISSSLLLTQAFVAKEIASSLRLFNVIALGFYESRRL